MNQLEQAIGSLADAMEGLRKRLEPVVRDAPDAGLPETKKEVEVTLPPLAQAIRSFRYRVNNVRGSLEGIVARLEI